MAEAAAALPVKEALLDGEIVVLDRAGVSSFQALQQADRARDGRGRLVYVAFDLLFLDGRDLRPLPLVERKDALARLLKRPPRPAALLGALRRRRASASTQRACRLGLEGIVSKRKHAPVHVAGAGRRGSRSSAWRARSS